MFFDLRDRQKNSHKDAKKLKEKFFIIKDLDIPFCLRVLVANINVEP